jgi:hypothetical protein
MTDRNFVNVTVAWKNTIMVHRRFNEALSVGDSGYY